MIVCWPVFAFNMFRYGCIATNRSSSTFNFELASWLPNEETGGVIAYVLDIWLCSLQASII